MFLLIRDGQKVYTTDIVALHSTMFLLIRIYATKAATVIPTLHSTMFLLIQSMFPDTPLGRILYIPQCFY